MQRICGKCGNDLVDLILSDEQRIEIWGLLIQDLKLFLTKKLMHDYDYCHRDAKIIVDHLNKDYGQCGRCDYDELTEENIDCPKCNAFNYNLNVRPSFNMDFCSQLEHSLDFEKSDEVKLRGFWCDGVSHLPEDISCLAKSRVEKDKKIKTKAWIGKDGQGVYEMTINFGEMSVEKYKSNSDLNDCIPNNNEDWIFIDPENNKIELQLL